MHHTVRKTTLPVSILLFALLISGCFIPYTSRNQIDLHEKLSQKKMKVAVLPFTLNTPPEEKRIGFDNVDVELTNKFTQVIWKKNKVRLAHADEILNAITAGNMRYSEINPDMKDLEQKPDLNKIVKLGESLEVDVVFLGTVRENSFEYQGGCCILIPSLMAKSRVYNIGAQMMAIDISRKEALAFDYIDNALAIPTKFFALTGKVSDEKLAQGKEVLLEKCGFALAYYAPMPEKRTDLGTLALATGAALLNIYAGTDFSVDATITDDTWKMYPEGYFEENYGYTREAFDKIAR
ncbi:MAG: hypothetical protein JSW54_08615 [Fidelibacterota bacterium]|nr:MAG: hypothetical protein JSW54_08615 [Candidatus Neomarinimicrobiota bacterium]